MIDLRDNSLDAEAVREALGLAPHPEGGAYCELWRDAPQDGGRGAATSILFLLAAGRKVALASRGRSRTLALAGGRAAEQASASCERCEASAEPTVHLGPRSWAPAKCCQGIVPAGSLASGRKPRRAGRWSPASWPRLSPFQALSWRRPAGRRAGKVNWRKYCRTRPCPTAIRAPATPRAARRSRG